MLTVPSLTLTSMSSALRRTLSRAPPCVSMWASPATTLSPLRPEASIDASPWSSETVRALPARSTSAVAPGESVSVPPPARGKVRRCDPAASTSTQLFSLVGVASVATGAL